LNNEYEIRGEATAIIIKSKKYGVLESLIDTSDLEKVKKAKSWWINSGDNAKSPYVRGYMTDDIGNTRKCYLHRLVLNISNPKNQADHVNHDTLDNRKSNLIVVSNAENCQNRQLYSNNTSGHIGITWHKQTGKWNAQIMVEREKKHLGLFDDINEAILARRAAEEKYFEYKISANNGTY
jgi:hypothetical protein